VLDEADLAAAALAEDSPENPALQRGAWLGASHGRDKAVLADAGSGTVGFPDWAEQLVAESTGKSATGVLPVAVEGVAAPEVERGDHDVVLGLLLGAEQTTATTDSSVASASPVPTARVAGCLGALFLLWETATAVAGRLLGINPFDQPDVESAKQAARGLLDDRPEPEPARFTEGALEVRGTDVLDGVDTVKGAVDAVLDRLGDDGYLAVMAYLDPEQAADLTDCRAALADRCGRPVTFGWGPRFLHSTGQYHKGGPPQGVFIQLTCDFGDDVEIPDRPFTFGTLIAAQAAGDARVLAEHGRPVLRLHLTDLEGGLRQVQEVLQ